MDDPSLMRLKILFQQKRSRGTIIVLKLVGTQNTPKKQYNMDTRIAKNPSEIPQSHNDFGEFE